MDLSPDQCGHREPSAKLLLSWPHRVSDLPRREAYRGCFDHQFEPELRCAADLKLGCTEFLKQLSGTRFIGDDLLGTPFATQRK